MIIIDPLKNKIINNLDQNHLTNITNDASPPFGTGIDFENLMLEYKKTIPDPDRKILFDFTPFNRFNPTFIYSFLEEIDGSNNKNILLLNEKNYSNFIEHIDKFKNISTLVFEDGEFIESIGNIYISNQLVEIINDQKNVKQTKESDLSIFRRTLFTEVILKELLFDIGIIDIPSIHDDLNTRKIISGNCYRIMDNEMLVSCYLRLKFLGNSPEKMLSLIYELLLYLQKYYTTSGPFEYDLLCVSSNTTLFLISLLGSFLSKPILVIDKLGPSPSLVYTSEQMRKKIKNKKVIYIEEVSATGSQIDRSILLLHHIGVDLQKIIVIYNLNVGIPRLTLEDDILISLCKPKDELKYIYRSS